MLHANLHRPKVELHRYLADEGAEMHQMNALAAIVAVSLAMLGTASMSAAQQTGAAGEEAAIRKVIDGFNNHEGKAAARMHTTDARFVSVRGDMMNGQTGIEKGLSAILTTGEERHAANDGYHGPVHTPDVALANVTNELSGLPSHQALTLRAFVKDTGVWQIAAFHNTLVAPFAPPIR